MPQLDAIISVSVAGFALSATPGPSMLYVLSRTVRQDRAAGLASAFGLALGGILLAVATAMGLAAVFAKVEWMVPALRYIGSAYLIWLGAGMIWEARSSGMTVLEVEQVKRNSFSRIVWQGVLVELLNPKTVLFFALFLPPFVAMGDGHLNDVNVQWQLLALGVLVPLTAIPTDIFVAYTGGKLTAVLNRQQRFREYLAWVSGAILILIALNLHFGFL